MEGALRQARAYIPEIRLDFLQRGLGMARWTTCHSMSNQLGVSRSGAFGTPNSAWNSDHPSGARLVGIRELKGINSFEDASR